MPDYEGGQMYGSLISGQVKQPPSYEDTYKSIHLEQLDNMDRVDPLDHYNST